MRVVFNTNTGGTERFLSEELHLTPAVAGQEQSETIHPLCLSYQWPNLSQENLSSLCPSELAPEKQLFLSTAEPNQGSLGETSQC